MRALHLCGLILLPAVLHSQTPAVAVDHQTEAAIRQALCGEWTGVLQYRDYSMPAASTERVSLPTWLTVSSCTGPLRFHYLYDDGPNKIVDETLSLTFDVPNATLQITNDHGRIETYKVAGYANLHDGHGDLVVLGPTVDNNRPAESRITLGIRPNLFTWVEEVRPTSAVPFAFRHSYTFTRARPPALKPQ